MPRRVSYRRRRSRRYTRTAYGGRTKRLVDGHAGQMIRVGVAAIPWLIKSVKLLKGFINTEAKYFDYTATANPSTTMQYANLTAIQNGTADTERIGNKILLKDVLMRMRFIMNASATATTVRWILFCDKEYDGVDPSAPLPLASANTEAPLDMNYSKRFVIIKTGEVNMSLGAIYNTTRKVYRTLNFHCDYDANTGADTSCKENQLILAYMSNEATNTPTMSIQSRVKFYDT